MNSFITWMGGKKQLRKKIIAIFPEDYSRYIEIFGGAGWVLFGLDKPVKQEIFNDIDGELINLWRCIKHHPNALQEELHGFLYSREIFNDAMSQLDVQGLTDIQRAARYFILIHNSFGGKKRCFAAGSTGAQNKIKLLGAVSTRLEKTIIEHRDFAKLIEQYDRPDALFYADPPYYKAERVYTHTFTEEDHIRLRDTLANIRGKFILSYNDCEYIRNLYQDYNITAITRTISLRNSKQRKDGYREIIITNY